LGAEISFTQAAEDSKKQGFSLQNLNFSVFYYSDMWQTREGTYQAGKGNREKGERPVWQ